jgi:KAP family P-loop domain
LGWRFLEKIVQLPLSLPQPSPKQTAQYLASLFDPAGGNGQRTERLDPVAFQQQVDRAIDDLRHVGLADAPSRLAEVTASILDALRPEEAADARRQIVAAVFEQSFNDADPVVQKTIGAEARQLPARNAREIKRLLNLFRFYSFIAVRNRVLDFSSEASIERTLGLVARLAALSIRWPYLLDVVARPGAPDGSQDDDARPRILLEDLEEAAGKADADWATAMAAAKLDKVPWTADLREFCRGEPAIGTFARDFL